MNIKEIRTFIPSKNYEVSRTFYKQLGFKGESAGDELTVFAKNGCTFFLQKYYNEEFAKNLMLQLIVPCIQEAFESIAKINISDVKHSEIKEETWGKVVYLWGPSGELLHVTELGS